MVANLARQVVSVDYVMDDMAKLNLDLATVKTVAAPITMWPHGIRTALESLQIN